MRRLASIDIGSQTIRLLVADIGPDIRLIPIFKDRAIVRLGEGTSESGFLHAEAIKRAVVCIEAFTNKARHLHAEATYATATACVRSASNKNDFLSAVHHAAGIMPRVLSGREEANIALTGVKSVLTTLPALMIVLDIGGGSTEIIAMDGKTTIKTLSIPLGVIGLTERFFMHDPPVSHEVSTMESSIRTMLLKHGLCDAAFTRSEAVIGTAGTVTTLAAMDMGMREYDPTKINGYCMTKGTVQDLYGKMLSLPAEERSRIPGLEYDRSIVLPAGTAILLEAMHLLKKKNIQVSDGGLLEGILLQRLECENIYRNPVLKAPLCKRG